jgi:hypothetical protein
VIDENTLASHPVTASLDFFEFSHVFQPSFDDISAICWPILMQNSVLETLLVVNYMNEI